MTKHHLRYKNFHPRTIRAAEALFSLRPSQLHESEQIEAAETFLDEIMVAYKLPVSARVSFDPFIFGVLNYNPALVEEDSLGNMRVDRDAEIRLQRWSILTLFHGARAHILSTSDIDPRSEDDPSDWACSLFYQVKPRLFRALARENRVLGVTARDTYKAESWNKLVEAGVTADDYLTVSPPEAWAILQDRHIDTIEQYANSGVSESDTTSALPETVGDGLSACNRDALRRLAAEHGIPGRGSMTRDQLENALREAGVRA